VFEKVAEGRWDHLRAMAELDRIWRSLPDSLRQTFDEALTQHNRIYGEKYGIELEAWSPTRLELARMRLGELPSRLGAYIRNLIERVRRLFAPHPEDIPAIREAVAEVARVADAYRSGKASLDDLLDALNAARAKVPSRSWRWLDEALYETLGTELADRLYGYKKALDLLKRYEDEVGRIAELVAGGALDPRLAGHRLAAMRERLQSVGGPVEEFDAIVKAAFRTRGVEPPKLEALPLRERLGITTQRHIQAATSAVDDFLKRLDVSTLRSLQELLELEALRLGQEVKWGRMALEEAGRRFAQRADYYGKIAETLFPRVADAFRERAELMKAFFKDRDRVEELIRMAEEKKAEEKLPDQRDVEMLRRAEEEWQRRAREGGGRGTESGRQQLLLLEKPQRRLEPERLPDLARRLEELRQRSPNAFDAAWRIAFSGRDPEVVSRYRGLFSREELEEILKLADEVEPLARLYRAAAELSTYPLPVRDRLVRRIAEKYGADEEFLKKIAADLPQTSQGGWLDVYFKQVVDVVNRHLFANVHTPTTTSDIATPKPHEPTRPVTDRDRTTRDRARIIPATTHPPTTAEPPRQDEFTGTTPEYTSYPPPEYPTAYPPPDVYTTTTFTPTTYTTPYPPPEQVPIETPSVTTVPSYDVPSYEVRPLPFGWWRTLPPSLFAERDRQGAYAAQAGRRQILALA
jgi:hypothetical protein